jgi:hypothetical protein
VRNLTCFHLCHLSPSQDGIYGFPFRESPAAVRQAATTCDFAADIKAIRDNGGNTASFVKNYSVNGN